MKLRHRYWLGVFIPLAVFLALAVSFYLAGVGWLFPIAFFVWIVVAVVVNGNIACPNCGGALEYRGSYYVSLSFPSKCHWCQHDLRDA